MRNLIEAIWPEGNSIKRILDLGCGDLWFTCGFPGVEEHVGIDIWSSSIEKAKAKNCKGFTGYAMDLQEYLRLQPADSFDAVLAIDVIEHFPEDRARFILTEMERVASKLCIVWTTLGFIEQGEFDNNGEFNPYQKHLYGPQIEDFEGWTVETYPDWHGDRGGAIFAYKTIEKTLDVEEQLRKLRDFSGFDDLR